MNEYLEVLRERAMYLQGRIAAKRAVPTADGLGWDTDYDERERAALLWAIAQLTGEDRRKDERRRDHKRRSDDRSVNSLWPARRSGADRRKS